MTDKIRANDVLDFLASGGENVDVAHALTVLSMALCQIAVVQGIPKENVLSGMGATYDAYANKYTVPEGTQCH